MKQTHLKIFLGQYIHLPYTDLSIDNPLKLI